jgi:hypothetical protein
MTDTTWVDWLAANPDATDADKLAALRERIAHSARWFVGTERGLTPEWINKKLAKLGVADRIARSNSYSVTFDVTSGKVTIGSKGDNRADAIANALERVGRGPLYVADVDVDVDPASVTIEGPEDVSPVAAADGPQTVDATLAALHEIMLLAVVSGPKLCVPGVNNFLEAYGLAPVPDRKAFVVRRPVQSYVETIVEAYDEASAQRVASWRWEDGQQGFKVTAGDPLGDLEVVPQS